MPKIKLCKINDSTKSINPQMGDPAALASEKREIETQRVSSRKKVKTNENYDIDAIMAHSLHVSQEDIETHLGNHDTTSA